MNYRENTKNGDKLSILGYGCMRFPSKGGSIDEERTEKQIISAIENGVNYFDTAYIYYMGKSEEILGNILAKGYRDKVKIATKLPHYLVSKASDIDKIFNKQISRLKTDHIDYYLMHMLPDLHSWERLKSLGIIEWIANKKKSGQIINLGFSYHGGKNDFIELVDAYDWDFCQLQYNFIDENNQAGKSGLMYAHSKGIPIIIMEPLRGGKIVNRLPKEVNDIWENAKPHRSAAEWALRWVWNHKEALVVLSGMSTEEQIEENIRIASDVQADSLSKDELFLFDKVKEVLQKNIRVNCTGCGYCLPCPSGVNIPQCFAEYNEKYINKGIKAKFNYAQNTGVMTKNPGNASLCIKCKKCESHCPQKIPISEKMTDVAREMEGFMFKPAVYVMKKIMRLK